MAFAADITSISGAQPGIPPIIGGIPGLSAPAKPAKAKIIDQRDDIAAQGALLSFDLIRETVEECLLETIRDTSGDVAGLLADGEILEMLHQIFGHKRQVGSLGRTLKSMADAFAALAERQSSPDSAVLAMSTFTHVLQSLSDRIVELRLRTDGQVEQSAEETNRLLRSIATLNGKIASQTASGERDPSLLARRDQELAALAGCIDFTSFTRQDGSVALFSKKGQPLADGPPTHIAVSDPATMPDEPPMAAPGGACIAGEDSIHAHFTTGSLPALLRNRGKTLPGVQCQLDTLAQTLQSRLNQLTNRALSGPDARQIYEGSRCFTDPARHRLGIAGGDTIVALIGADGQSRARASLRMLLKAYRNQNGLPDSELAPLGQIPRALNLWLNQQFGSQAVTYAQLTGAGRLAVELPASPQTSLAFRDQRSTAYQTEWTGPADKALGLKGPLRFVDGAQNRLGLVGPGQEVGPQDSLASVMARLNRSGGLVASLESTLTGTALRVSSAINSDLLLDPDSTGASVVAGLGLLPAANLPADDIAINHLASSRAAAMSGRLFDKTGAALGLTGILTIADETDRTLCAIRIDPQWSLETLGAQIDAHTRPQGIQLSLPLVGNRHFLKLVAPAGQKIGIPGHPDAQMSVPRQNFVAKGGELTLRLGPQTIATMTIRAGDSLAELADRMNDPAHPFAMAGLATSLRVAGDWHALELGGGNGDPIQLSGSAVGSSEGQLEFRLNPRDQLGLLHPADQSIPGFANFFGLNDIFVADPPEQFDTKNPPGLFVSNAPPGTARALSVNPRLRDHPETLGDWTTIGQISDLLTSPINFAAAGALPRSQQSLVDYADSIVEWAEQTVQTVQSDHAYKDALLQQMARQKTMLPHLDMNDRLDHLAAFQQAHNDSLRLLSSMPKLLDSLGSHFHG